MSDSDEEGYNRRRSRNRRERERRRSPSVEIDEFGREIQRRRDRKRSRDDDEERSRRDTPRFQHSEKSERLSSSGALSASRDHKRRRRSFGEDRRGSRWGSRPDRNYPPKRFDRYAPSYPNRSRRNAPGMNRHRPTLFVPCPRPMTYRQYLLRHGDDRVAPEETVAKYEAYKKDFEEKTLRSFFESHCDTE